MSGAQPMSEESALAAANALGMILTAPPHSLHVSISISPKAPTFGEHTSQTLRPFLRHSGEKFDKRYEEFVGMFFEDNRPKY
jgi:hypothetical protein